MFTTPPCPGRITLAPLTTAPHTMVKMSNWKPFGGNSLSLFALSRSLPLPGPASSGNLCPPDPFLSLTCQAQTWKKKAQKARRQLPCAVPGRPGASLPAEASVSVIEWAQLQRLSQLRSRRGHCAVCRSGSLVQMACDLIHDEGSCLGS